jgi:hypothetical protein
MTITIVYRDGRLWGLFSSLYLAVQGLKRWGFDPNDRHFRFDVDVLVDYRLSPNNIVGEPDSVFEVTRGPVDLTDYYVDY